MTRNFFELNLLLKFLQVLSKTLFQKFRVLHLNVGGNLYFWSVSFVNTLDLLRLVDLNKSLILRHVFVHILYVVGFVLFLIAQVVVLSGICFFLGVVLFGRGFLWAEGSIKKFLVVGVDICIWVLSFVVHSNIDPLSGVSIRSQTLFQIGGVGHWFYLRNLFDFQCFYIIDLELLLLEYVKNWVG